MISLRPVLTVRHIYRTWIVVVEHGEFVARRMDSASKLSQALTGSQKVYYVTMERGDALIFTRYANELLEKRNRYDAAIAAGALEPVGVGVCGDEPHDRRAVRVRGLP